LPRHHIRTPSSRIVSFLHRQSRYKKKSLTQLRGYTFHNNNLLTRIATIVPKQVDTLSFSYMQYLNNILALAAVASAIDLQGHLEPHCRDGATVTWQNIQPNQCHSKGGYFHAISFNAIPRDWRIITRGYDVPSCPSNHLRNQFNSDGKDWICHGDTLSRGSYGAGSYSFANKKRSGPNDVESQECRKPDLLTLKDGQSYTLGGVPDEIVQAMVSQSSSKKSCRLIVL
jgi:hypothetical protein